MENIIISVEAIMDTEKRLHLLKPVNFVKN